MSEVKRAKELRDRFNLLRFSIVFAVFYWILESVRDVLVFEKGNIFERIFFPDMMSFWMRFLVVCILVLFGVYAQSLKHKMEKQKFEQNRSLGMVNILKAGFCIGLLYWILESVRDVFIFNRGSLIERILTPDPMSFWMRLLAVFIIVLFTIYAQALINERRKAEEALRKEQEKLERMVEERTAELTESNRLLRLLKKEIKERTRMGQELCRVNRALKTMGECNMALVRATEEMALLKDVCDIIVKVGGYSLVWVGYAKEDRERNVRVLSKAGWDDDYLNTVRFTWDDEGGIRNPVGRAIRNKKPCIVKNGQGDAKTPQWRFEATKRGYASSISLPLMRNSVAFGALNIYSTERDAFDEQEVRLLTELTNDLAFGIMVLRTRIAHKRAEEEKERIQVQLLQARKMEAIGILAGGVAHDFNNLLTAILGCVDMAIMDMDESNPTLKDLKEIEASAQRAAELTKQLLLFSRKQPMRFLPVNINEIVDELSKMLHRLIGEDIILTTELEKDLWSVRADRGTLEQVIMNLTVNAKDAMPNGGKLKVMTANIVLTENQCENIPEAQSGRWVRISVSDTGVGIDRKTIRHIFEPFFSTKEVGEGTGLGLSVVYGIVKQHDGWMNVTSQAGQGSTFQVYLPVFRTKPEIINEKKIQPKIRKSRVNDARILVVEDEEKVRKFTANGLNRNGYSVFCASNAQEASSIFQKEKGNFNAVLCDVVLPDKNGLDLVDEFLNFKPHLGVLMCSGYTGKKSQRSTIMERGFRFLQKPYTLNDLLHIMHDVTQSLPA